MELSNSYIAEMDKETREMGFVRSMIIVLDFIILNVLFFVYVNLDFINPSLIGKNNPVMLQMVANLAFFIAQYFFSNIVHKRKSTGVEVLRQVSYFIFVYLLAFYLLVRLVSRYEGYSAPSVKFTICFVIVFYVALLLSRLLERSVLKYYRTRDNNIRKVVLVGTDKVLLSVYEYFVGDPSLGYNVTGYYADTPMEDCPDGLRYKGTLDDLDKVMEKPLEFGTADELYCSLSAGDMDRMLRIMKYCNNNVVHFYYVPTFSNIFGQSFIQEQVGETTVFTNYDEPLTMATNKFIKRMFDIVMSLCVLILLLPFTPLIALVIKVQSPKGPIFFKQARTGLNGREFYCYKFRSMHVNKDADLVQATKNDPRKFAFGNFMRKSNIDELPQFWNVLKGDMSVVGPRPHMLRHTEIYRQLIDKYMVRHFVKPGITGWAQVTGFRGETKEPWQMEGRVKRDIWYIENWSIWLDLQICWRTIRQIFVHDKNAY